MRGRLQRQNVTVLRTGSHNHKGRTEEEGREKYGEPAEILPGLFLGSAYNARHAELLQRLQIEKVLCVAEEERSSPECERINVRDDVDALEPMLQAAQWIKEHRHQRVLVHCLHGKSRSAGAVITYLCKYEGHSYEQALQFVKEKRPIVSPNQFIHQVLLKLNNKG